MLDTSIHEISESALPDFLARIAKLSKKSMKLLGKPIVPVFHEDVVREVRINGMRQDLAGNKFVQVFHRVSVSGETPKINGWTFLATLDHTHEAGNVVKALPWVGDLPVHFRTAKPYCEHCSKLRRRNDTFVLRNTTDGSYKQIGRSCLRDFIGYDVSAITESAKWLSQMEPSERDGEGGYKGVGKVRDIKLVSYLAHTHAVIRTCGWVSKADADVRGLTRTSVAAIFNMFPGRSQDRIALTDRDREIAEQVLTWVRGMTPRSQYENNIFVIGSENYIGHDEIGLAASMVQALFNQQAWAIKRAAEQRETPTTSEHIGTVAERLYNLDASVFAYHSFQGDRGPVHVFSLRTPEGNVLIWYASSAKELSIGDHIVLDGTVKAHRVSTYKDTRGVKQTVLTRCKFEVKEAVAA